MSKTVYYVGGGVVLLGGLGYYLWSRRKKDQANVDIPLWVGTIDTTTQNAIDEAGRLDRVAENAANIVLPSSFPDKRNVVSAFIKSLHHGYALIDVAYYFNAGYELVVNSQKTRITRDAEDVIPENAYGCFDDWESCEVDLYLEYAPILNMHSRTGAGVPPDVAMKHGTLVRTVVRSPLCTAHCKDENTYFGNITVRYSDPLNPAIDRLVTRADGRPLRFAYGEEAKSDCGIRGMTAYVKKSEALCQD
jgi:hypothetical protein